MSAALSTHLARHLLTSVTDDQDVGTLQPRFLPHLFRDVADEGVLYENFFAPVSVCCPSRVSLLRAQYAHNHNITFVSEPWGGWDVFNAYGYVGHTVPDFLQQAGYATYYTGKLMNAHTESNCESLPVSGFTESDILVDPYTYDYWNPGFSKDNGPVKVHKGEYTTDLVADKALGYLDKALSRSEPFFLGIAPVASHSHINHTTLDAPDKIQMATPEAHPRHLHLFANETVPRHEGFNPDHPTGVSWVKDLPKLNATHEAYLDDFFRARLRTLQPVDELVRDIVQRLDAAGQLDNTYIFYTSDNGYALGTHRRQPGKTLGFEEDIHVPLLVRGPGVARGVVDRTASYGMVDLARTILDVAGAGTDYENDGVRIDLHQGDATGFDFQSTVASAHDSRDARHAISEYWVLAADEGKYGGHLRVNNTYRTVRVHDGGHTWSYSVWCTGERELYDLHEDPHQVRNLLAAHNGRGPFAAFGPLADHTRRVAERLDALTLVLKTCVADACRRPFAVLFPRGEAGSFAEALEPRFDAYFANLPRVQFKECALGFQSRLEKPEWEHHLAYKSHRGGGEGGSEPLFVVQG